jgi:hypothetical protein
VSLGLVLETRLARNNESIPLDSFAVSSTVSNPKCVVPLFRELEGAGDGRCDRGCGVCCCRSPPRCDVTKLLRTHSVHVQGVLAEVRRRRFAARGALSDIFIE